MQKREFSDRGTYECPTVTWLDIRVEQGFAVSFDASGGTLDDYDTPGGSGSGQLTEEEW